MDSSIENVWVVSRQAAGLKTNKSGLGIEEADKGNLSEWGGVGPLYCFLLLTICKCASHTQLLGTGQRVVSIDLLGDGEFLPLKVIIFLRVVM